MELSAAPRRHRESHRQSVRGTPKETFRACYYMAHTRLSVFEEKDVSRAPLPGVSSLRALRALAGTVLFQRNRHIAVIFGGSVLVTPLALILARLFGRRLVLQTHGLDIIYRSFLYAATVRSLVEELR